MTTYSCSCPGRGVLCFLPLFRTVSDLCAAVYVEGRFKFFHCALINASHFEKFPSPQPKHPSLLFPWHVNFKTLHGHLILATCSQGWLHHLELRHVETLSATANCSVFVLPLSLLAFLQGDLLFNLIQTSCSHLFHSSSLLELLMGSPLSLPLVHILLHSTHQFLISPSFR